MNGTVFIAGATGYLGRRLAQALLDRGHQVRALTREGSQGRIPPGCAIVRGNALDAASYADFVPPADTFVHLVGTSHPAPWKGAAFATVDLGSLRESVAVAQSAGIGHFVFVSVAHPAPVMKAYIRMRCECERILAESGLNATVLRPWYVLGPGHRWPVILEPLYRLAERIPATCDGARRLGLVRVDQMVTALQRAVEEPAFGLRVIEVPEIRSIAAVTGLPADPAPAIPATAGRRPSGYREPSC